MPRVSATQLHMSLCPARIDQNIYRSTCNNTAVFAKKITAASRELSAAVWEQMFLT